MFCVGGNVRSRIVCRSGMRLRVEEVGIITYGYFTVHTQSFSTADGRPIKILWSLAYPSPVFQWLQASAWVQQPITQQPKSPKALRPYNPGKP